MLNGCYIPMPNWIIKEIVTFSLLYNILAFIILKQKSFIFLFCVLHLISYFSSVFLNDNLILSFFYLQFHYFSRILRFCLLLRMIVFKRIVQLLDFVSCLRPTTCIPYFFFRKKVSSFIFLDLKMWPPLSEQWPLRYTMA